MTYISNEESKVTDVSRLTITATFVGKLSCTGFVADGSVFIHRRVIYAKQIPVYA